MIKQMPQEMQREISELEDFIFENSSVKSSFDFNSNEKETLTELPETEQQETLTELPETEQQETLGFFIDTGDNDSKNAFFIDTGDNQESAQEQEITSSPKTEASSPPPSSPKTESAWADNDDQDLMVNLDAKNRLKKLKRDFDEVEIDRDDYEKRLRAQYQRINPTPAWAQVTEAKNEDPSIFSTTKALLKKSPVLNPDKLDIVRAKDANQQEYSQATIQKVAFHPKAPVMFSVGLDKTLRLFHIDGKDNQKVQSYFIKDMPIFSANFTPDGSEIILTGRRNYFYSLGLESGRVTRTFGIRGRQERSFEWSYVSPCNKYIIVLGKDGYIILLSAKTKQWVANLKMNSGVVDVAFSPSSNQLWSLGFDGSVYQWNLDTKSCLHVFTDNGSIRGTAISISPNEKLIAVGSSSGVVNLYDIDTVTASENPQPKKVIMNLTTSVSNILFHPGSDLLVISSKTLKDSLKIIHIPTLQVVKNWPTDATPLGYVFTTAFSPDGQYLTIGNDKGKVLLYRLEAFAQL